MEKIRQTIYVKDETYIEIREFCIENGLDTLSKGIESIIPEWKRFKIINARLTEQLRKEQEGDANKD